MQASKSGQGATTCLNAANEVAVDAFLHSKIGYLDIATVVEGVLQKVNVGSLSSIDEVLDTDRQAREIAKSIVGAL